MPRRKLELDRKLAELLGQVSLNLAQKGILPISGIHQVPRSGETHLDDTRQGPRCFLESLQGPSPESYEEPLFLRRRKRRQSVGDLVVIDPHCLE